MSNLKTCNLLDTKVKVKPLKIQNLQKKKFEVLNYFVNIWIFSLIFTHFHEFDMNKLSLPLYRRKIQTTQIYVEQDFSNTNNKHVTLV